MVADERLGVGLRQPASVLATSEPSENWHGATGSPAF